MDQQRNLIIAVALSIAILLAFQFFIAQPNLHHQQAQKTQTTEQTTQPSKQPSTIAPGTTAPSTQPAPGTAAAPGATSAAPIGAAPRAEVLAKSPRVAIDTPQLHGSINLVGARVDDLTLVNYHETIDPKSPEIVLLSPNGTEHPYFVQFGWAPADPKTKVPGPDARWTSAGGKLTPQHPVELSWDNGEGLRFTRTYTVDKDYLFTVIQTVENHSDKPVTLYPYALASRAGEVPVSPYWLVHVGPIGVMDGTLHDGTKYSSIDPGKPVQYTSKGGWIGFTDKYWLTALIPDQSDQLQMRFSHEEPDHINVYQADYRAGPQTVAPGTSVTTKDRFFAGAKEVDLLDRYTAEAGIPRFDRAVDFGWLYFLAKPIFLALDFFYKLIGNFGVAILLLTVIIKAVFFPLANKSYRAMSKMKMLQPEMQKLRERFGDDKARLNQEMMALYKRVGANPMAGCLPIIIQLPVFYALYQVLYVTIEMRHAPFFGWIHDLSAPDPTTFINLFGLIPYTPPHISFLMIGAWPILMGITMFLQQKLNPQPADPMQAKMFMILPVVFTFMLAEFPAGLVIYWSWNNLLSIAQQWLIMRRVNVK
jgi:YidC/Oxa1 family membrane protein insertase